jgi:hypothetical protein
MKGLVADIKGEENKKFPAGVCRDSSQAEE